MKKVIIFISTATLIIAICFSGCYKSLYQYINDPVPGDEIFVYKSTQEYSTKESLSESITEIETTKPETTTNKNSNSDTTTKPTEQKSAGHTTTKKVTTTQKSTTTNKQTTTKKVITTQKPTTTKKVTTAENEWNCNVDGHSCKVGPIGWVVFLLFDKLKFVEFFTFIKYQFDWITNHTKIYQNQSFGRFVCSEKVL